MNGHFFDKVFVMNDIIRQDIKKLESLIFGTSASTSACGAGVIQ